MQFAKTTLAVLALALFAALPATVGNADTIYVDNGATGTNDGTSWQDAFTELQSALDVVNSGDEIWVAEGTYTPSQETDPGDPRSATFQLINGVEIYGGFQGVTPPPPGLPDGETQRDQRDPVANETLLSGDLAGNDDSGGDTSENSYHVVSADDTITHRASTILNGFTITAGNADDLDGEDYSGGGMNNIHGSPTVSNCTFSGNSADCGGGMYNVEGDALVTDCTFTGNRAVPLFRGSGGGMHNECANTTMINCTFSENSSIWRGGGMYSEFNYDNEVTVIDCTFTGNSSGGSGGGMYNYMHSIVTVINCTFTGNSANGSGGGMYNYEIEGANVMGCAFIGNTSGWNGAGIHIYWSEPTAVTNCTIVNNTAGGCGGGMYSGYNLSSPAVTNCIFWYNSDNTGTGPSAQICDDYELPWFDPCTVTYSCIEGGWPGTGNFAWAPWFTDDDYRLVSGSPCIDSGDNTAVPPDTPDLDGDGDTTEPIPFDLDGNPRFVDNPNRPDTGIGPPPVVDMGAYEVQFPRLLGAASRRAHGTVGDFDIALALDPPESAAVECRQGGPTRVVLTFSEDVKAADDDPDQTEVSLTCGGTPCGTVEAVGIAGNVMTIDMSGIPDATCLAIVVNGIKSLEGKPLSGDNDVHIAVLAGDTNGDNNTNLIDMAQVKSKNGSDPASAGNARFDVNTNGHINLIDMALVKSLNGNSVSCP